MKYEKDKTKRTTVRFTPDQAKHLETVEKKEGLYPSEYIRRLVDADMQNRHLK